MLLAYHHGSLCLHTGISRESELRPCAEFLYNPSYLHFAARVSNRIEQHFLIKLIFSINTILPMISVVYWENELPARYRLRLNLTTLLGSMLGQVSLGYLADRLGRRKVYGLELTFTIMASLRMAISSPGVFNSMSLIGLLIWWRVVMGIGVGSGCPLSAVLTVEYV